MQALWDKGYARLGELLTRTQCEDLRALYDDDSHFRSRIDMVRYRFGRGEYKYFQYPLPGVVETLRRDLYCQLAATATEWMKALGYDHAYPATHAEFLAYNSSQGQKRPTPLLLRYRAGDFNCLHQDVYGPVVFPFQVIVALSDPDREYTGGELMLVEQRPRAQSVGQVIRLKQGEGVVITTRYGPVMGSRGYYRASLKHGVSTVEQGERFTLGVIFHDAE